ncbi:MAG: hypothetical protein OER97_00325 [Gammaproteobacteria bacterium]|nr:hypothetical protein [Gammaproteobacteria bacterium]
MPDSKNVKWVDDYKEDSSSAANSDNADNAVAPVQPAANDADGWQKYRHWISKAPAPRGRRVGIDPSLYTWKGYRNWTEQVKRSWSGKQGDSD